MSLYNPYRKKVQSMMDISEEYCQALKLSVLSVGWITVIWHRHQTYCMTPVHAIVQYDQLACAFSSSVGTDTTSSSRCSEGAEVSMEGIVVGKASMDDR